MICQSHFKSPTTDPKIQTTILHREKEKKQLRVILSQCFNLIFLLLLSAENTYDR